MVSAVDYYRTAARGRAGQVHRACTSSSRPSTSAAFRRAPRRSWCTRCASIAASRPSARSRRAPGTHWDEERGLNDTPVHRARRGRRRRDPQQRLGVGFAARMTSSMPAAPSPIPRLIARWDLDKTYLRTDFDTVRDLVRTAIERPDQKRTVPGAAALLRELGARQRRDPHPLGEPRAAPIAPRAEAPPRRRALGVAHAQAATSRTCSACASARCAGSSATSCRRCSSALRAAPSARRDGDAAARGRCSATTPRPTPSCTRSSPTSARAWSTGISLAEVMRRGRRVRGHHPRCAPLRAATSRRGRWWGGS